MILSFSKDFVAGRNQNLIIADGSAPELLELLQGAKLPYVVIRACDNPLQVISMVLAGERLDALHIVAHGEPGAFWIGGQRICASALARAHGLLSQWDVGEIALWSCAVGSNSSLAQELERVIGVPVYASDTALGATHTGPNWQLSPAQPNTFLPFEASVAAEWPYQLASLLFAAVSYRAEDGRAAGSLKADVETNSLKLLNFLDQAAGAVKYVFISEPPQDPIYSGNNVRGYLYAVDINNNVVNTYFGEISRLVKSGSTVMAGQMYVYPEGTTTGIPSTTLLIDFGIAAPGTFAINNIIGTSSDPVDAALNKLLIPAALTATPISDQDAVEAGFSDADGVDADGSLLSGIQGGRTVYSVSGGILIETKSSVTISNISSANETASILSASGETEIQGLYGSLFVSADGSYRYEVNNLNVTVDALNASETLSEDFTYSVADGSTAITNKLTITVNGANDAPSAKPDFNIAKEAEGSQPGFTASGNVLTNDTDVDSGDGKVISGFEINGTITGNSYVTSLVYASFGGAFSSGNGSVYPAYRLNATTGSYEAVTDSTGNAVNLTQSGTGQSVTFQLSDTSAVKTGDVLYVTRDSGATYLEVARVQTAAGTSNAVEISAFTGTLAVGGTVNFTGAPSPLTILKIAYDQSGKPSAVLLSQQVTVTSSTNMTVSGAVAEGDSITGLYGTLTLLVGGDYIYTPFSNNTALSEGQTAEDVFNYTMEDDAGVPSSSTLSITVQGSSADDPDASPDVADGTPGAALGAAVEAGTDEAGTISFGNVISNDVKGVTPTILSAGSLNVADNTLSAITNKIIITEGTLEKPAGTYYAVEGQYGTLYINAAGDYFYEVNNANARVDALNVGDTLVDIFNYTLTDAGGGIDSATLSITVNGSDDATVTKNDFATAQEVGGYPDAPTEGFDPSGNVLTNDRDVDNVTFSVTSIRSTDPLSNTGAFVSSGTTIAPSGETLVPGLYGALYISQDGSWRYVVNQADPDVNSLAAGETLPERFEYTVTDGTSAVLEITINGANDYLVVNDVLINEASNWAVFEVTGSSGQVVSLAVQQGTALMGDANLGVGPAMEVWDGSKWSSYSGSAQIPLTGPLYVRVATDNEQDDIFEGVESFKLVATSADGSDAFGTGGIVDDGTGVIFADGPATDPTKPENTIDTGLDDDRAGITVTGKDDVSEGSNAIFQVDLSNASLSATEISLNLTNGTTDSVEGVPQDYSSTFSAYYYDEKGAQTALTITNGKISLPAGVTQFFVSVATTDDSVLEGSETFDLTAAITDGSSDTGTATIKDDGTGQVYKDDGTVDTEATPDDDRAGITVTGKDDVSEGSNAIFQVDLSNASLSATEISLNLTNGTTDSVEGVPQDYSSTFSAYYYDEKGAQTALTITNGKISLPAGVTQFFVSVATTDDSVLEGSETFDLTAAITDGSSDTGTATIKDDGTGQVYKDDGTVDTEATPDDDRAGITVTGKDDVSEGSNAIFQVDLSNASLSATEISLNLTNGTTDSVEGVPQDYSSTFSAYYYDEKGAQTALTITNGKISLPAGVTQFFVSVATTDDSVLEGSETFDLTAAITDGSSDTGTATIKDDGTGQVYKDDGTVDTEATPDDDRAGITVTGKDDVSEGSNAIFQVDLSNASLSATEISLNLTNGTTDSVEGVPQDYSSTFSAYYYDEKGAQTALTITNGKISLPAGVTQFFVSVATTDDSVLEGSETFDLTAAITDGSSDTGTATIKDDGTGQVYKDDGTVDTEATPDDDRAGITVTGKDDVSEGSNAIFQVDLSNASLSATEISLNLTNGTTDSVEGVPQDYSSTFSAYYYDEKGAQTALTITNGKISLPAGVTQFFVSVATTDDSVLEGSETFDLTAAITDGSSDTGTATIKDDGTGQVYKDDGTVDTEATPDDDRAGITVTGKDDVSEGSNAIFQVDLSNASLSATEISLNLTNGTTDSVEGVPQDYSSTFSAYYYDEKGAQTALTITNGKISLPAGVTQFFVSVATTDDSVLEGSETFDLTAAITDGSSDTGTATIKDDGTGQVYKDDGTVDTEATPDDDRAGITVTGKDDVSEGSNAIFQVDLSNASLSATEISLNLTNGTTDSVEGVPQDYSSTFSAYYYDEKGAQTALTITNGKISLPAGVTQFFVSVATTDDSVLEGSETFDLTAAITDGSSDTGTATIKDDGTGQVYKDDGTVDTEATPDDDRAGITVTGKDDVSEGSNAIFQVDLSNASLSATEISLNLTNGTTDSVEGVPQDYSSTFSAYYYDEKGAQTALTITNGKISLPAGVTQFFVSVATTDDSVLEGSETFDLTAAITDGSSDTGTATIKDDGTGQVYKDDGTVDTEATPDDDRAGITVTGKDDVSEGSNAIFQVDLSNASLSATEISLNLTNGTTDSVEGVPQDYSSTFSAYYYDEKGAQTALTITNGKISLPAGVTQFFVSVATTDDSVLEGSETFDLTAAITDGSSDTGTATIKDDGTGQVYKDDGTVDTEATPDDDRAGITVTGKDDVSEGSNAIFQVDLSNASLSATEISLNLTNGTTDSVEGVPQDYSSTFSAYYYDEKGAQTALTITNGKISLPAGVTQFFVSVATTDDSVLEGSETFDLTAAITDGSSDTGTATIKDDGTGQVYKDDGTVDTEATPDDDRAGITVTGKDDVSEGSNAIFQVDLSNASLSATEISLNLTNGTTDSVEGVPQDYSSTFSAYYYDEKGAQTALTITNGKISLPAGVTQFFVSVATTDDSVLEGSETFDLTAAITDGSSDTGTATIKDDGTGQVYKDDGTVDTEATPDDDRAGITVTGKDDVSEGSNAIFQVDLSNASLSATEISLNLTNGTTDSVEGVPQDYSSTFSAYYYDEKGAQTALTITNGKISLPAGVTQFFVSVATTDDSVLEGSETFDLTAAITGGSSDTGTATIKDDGTGQVYKDDGTVDTEATPDDDRAKTEPFSADLDPTTDTGEKDRVTQEINPEFTVKGGSYLQEGGQAELLDPQGNVVGTALISVEDVQSGKINIAPGTLDDGEYTFRVQIRDPSGKVVATAPVTVTVVTDLDGVKPSVELGANGGDFNNDGLPDWQQNNVAQLPLASLADFQSGAAAPASSFGAILAGNVNSTNPAEAVELNAAAQLLNISLAPTPAPLPTNTIAATPLMHFSVTSTDNSQLADMDPTRDGLQTRVVIDLQPGGVIATTYLKWDASSGRWLDYLDDGNLATMDDGATLLDLNNDGRIDRVVVTLTDGGLGDEDGLANGIIVDPGMLAIKRADGVYSVLLANGDRYYTTDAMEAAKKAQGTGNVFEGVRFDSLQGAAHRDVYVNMLTGDWFFAKEGEAMPYACYVLTPGAGFDAAVAGQGPGVDFHLFMNSQGLTQLVTLQEAADLGLASKGYSNRGALFNTTTTSAFQFDAEAYLVANQSHAEIQELVYELATKYRSTSDVGFVDTVELHYLNQVQTLGLAHGYTATAADLNAVFGTNFIG